MKRVIAVTGLLLGNGIVARMASAQKATPGPVTQALEQEIKRAFELLKLKGNPAPYFISYAVRENESVGIEASMGALKTSQKDRSRLLDVDVRVGDYQLDSTHQIRGQRGSNNGPNFS